MEWKRSSGILLPVFSLPSRYGIGSLGQGARYWVDFLHQSGQHWWQILPVGPTGYCDSPYQSFSTFAGNPYFVDPDDLIRDGLLTQEEAEATDWGSDPDHIDYGKIYSQRFQLLETAAGRGLARDAAEVDTFRSENAGWLPDYALFMALKRHFNMDPWWLWPEEDIRLHKPEACERWRAALKSDVDLFVYIQFLFFRQWEALHDYAAAHEVGIIGDLPIYVAPDSADVWANPQWFQLDRQGTPTEVGGVPPDHFSDGGQLWGNPLYRWDRLEDNDFGWWIRRLDGAFHLFDAVRLDHFRGFESYWSVPFGSEDAKNGRWIQGPGIKFIRALQKNFPDNIFIAEDLGLLTSDVRKLQDTSGFPGMKVLEFAFDPGYPSIYLPHFYPRNCVCYTGTHDNPPLSQWIEEVPRETLDFCRRYLGLNEQEGYDWGILRGGMGSVADLFIAPFQDYLGTGAESRTNIPGTSGGNWRWRIRPDALTYNLAGRIGDLTARYGRES